MFSCTAFMPIYNEADIIPWTIPHLIAHGIQVHVLDNWSTDGSDQIAQSFDLAGFERFPVDGPSPYYSWIPILDRIADLASKCCTDWSMLHDADEIRRTNQSGERLIDGFARADQAGYSAVNFQAYHFRPVDDLYTGDPEKHFRYYTTDHCDSTMRQVKAWKNTGCRVGLSRYGGHFAEFPNIRVWPEKFILKHYPLRTSAQAERKVLRERMGRYDPIERARDWHVQYNQLAVSRQWLGSPENLKKWPAC